ncbi:MAG TPA: histidine kinase [Thermoanaerobaculia bacterium]|nr:histidine kinase [Thermoanaerobaculia bacterium]
MSRARATLIIFAVATFAALYFAAQAHWHPYLKSPIPHALAVNFTYYWLWGLVTPLVIAAAKRFRFEPGSWTRSIAAHVVISMGITALQFVLAESVLKAIGKRKEMDLWAQVKFSFLANFQSALPTYFLILFAYLAFDYYRKFRDREVRTAQLAAQLSAAQLQALKMQLKPHFLFNTLNSISSLMYTDVEAADEMLVKLSEFLRLTTDRELEQEVPLGQELEFVRRYLEIEKVRFEKRLHVSFDVGAEASAARVPALVLQPLIENAIHHGIGSRAEGGSIAISASRENDDLHIRVADDGVGSGEPRERVGLANTRARVEQFFGRLTFASAPEGGAVVDIVIPFRQ